jgi:uncharacterized protein (TIGR03067 family)
MLVIAIVCASFLATPAADENEQDLATLHGEWIIQSSMQNGGSGTLATKWVISENECTAEFPASARVVDNKKRTFTVDASKNPKHFDMKTSTGRVILGIYKLEGDTLTHCIGSGKRPTEFTSDDAGLIVWKRAPKKEK